jgi:hypothetical protein
LKNKKLPLALFAAAFAALTAANAYGYFSSLIVLDATIPFYLTLPMETPQLISATSAGLTIDNSSIASDSAIDVLGETDESGNGGIE